MKTKKKKNFTGLENNTPLASGKRPGDHGRVFAVCLFGSEMKILRRSREEEKQKTAREL